MNTIATILSLLALLRLAESFYVIKKAGKATSVLNGTIETLKEFFRFG